MCLLLFNHRKGAKPCCVIIININVEPLVYSLIEHCLSTLTLHLSSPLTCTIRRETREDEVAGGDQCGGSNQARCVMWTYKQCKTMLTHVFKPRWLVLILLSAGNREFRRGWEKAKFGEKEVERRDGGEREKEGEKGRPNENVRNRKREKTKR